MIRKDKKITEKKNINTVDINFPAIHMLSLGTNKKGHEFFKNSQFMTFLLCDLSDTKYKVKVDLRLAKIVNEQAGMKVHDHNKNGAFIIQGKEPTSKILIQYECGNDKETWFESMLVEWSLLKQLVEFKTTIETIINNNLFIPYEQPEE